MPRGLAPRFFTLARSVWIFVLVLIVIGGFLVWRNSLGKVVYASIEPETKFKLYAAVQKVRPGIEGWDLFVAVAAPNGKDIARATLTSIDLPSDVTSGDLKINKLALDRTSEELTVTFCDGKNVKVPVSLGARH